MKNQDTIKTLNKIATKVLLKNDCTEKDKEEFYSVINDLAHVVAFSVLRTLLDPDRKKAKTEVSNNGQSKKINSIRSNIKHNEQIISETRYTIDNDTYDYIYNQNGDLIPIIHDKDIHDYATKIMDTTFESESTDLIHECYMYILEELNAAAEREKKIGHKTIDFRREYPKRVLAKKIRYIAIQEDNAEQWKEIYITPFGNVYNRVFAYFKREAEQRKNVSSYSYIETRVKDDDTGSLEKQFIRSPHLTEYDTISDLENRERILKELGLSRRETEVLLYREQGYSLLEIAEYLRISKSTIQKCLKRVAEKARAIGLTPSKTIKHA